VRSSDNKPSKRTRTQRLAVRAISERTVAVDRAALASALRQQHSRFCFCFCFCAVAVLIGPEGRRAAASERLPGAVAAGDAGQSRLYTHTLYTCASTTCTFTFTFTYAHAALRSYDDFSHSHSIHRFDNNALTLHVITLHDAHAPLCLCSHNIPCMYTLYSSFARQRQRQHIPFNDSACFAIASVLYTVCIHVFTVLQCDDDEVRRWIALRVEAKARTPLVCAIDSTRSANRNVLPPIDPFSCPSRRCRVPFRSVPFLCILIRISVCFSFRFSFSFSFRFRMSVIPP